MILPSNPVKAQKDTLGSSAANLMNTMRGNGLTVSEKTRFGNDGAPESTSDL